MKEMCKNVSKMMGHYKKSIIIKLYNSAKVLSGRYSSNHGRNWPTGSNQTEANFACMHVHGGYPISCEYSKFAVARNLYEFILEALM